jgi:branched-chain amino acid transport system permease protein
VLTDAISGSLRGLGSAFDIDFLRQADITRLRTLIYGTALVVLMLVRPEGILPSARRKMELHAADEDEGEAAQSRESLFESQR